ncbi:MAG: TIGR03750 family conjugal transfer protein [Gilliamella apicola]|nr:TIGR03750 family conjugal transfer protein [Gilliamella apicola]
MIQNINDKSIELMPDRLNRIPVVYKGMTVSEIGILALAGSVLGAILGVILFILFGRWIIILICIIFMPLPTIYFAGTKLAKLKRGKPDTWLIRKTQLFWAKYGFNKKNLIFDDQLLLVRRIARSPKRNRRHNRI